METRLGPPGCVVSTSLPPAEGGHGTFAIPKWHKLFIKTERGRAAAERCVWQLPPPATRDVRAQPPQTAERCRPGLRTDPGDTPS